MATTPKNRIVRTDNIGSVFPDATKLVDTTVSFNQGDLIAIVSNKLKAMVSDSDSLLALGIAPVTVVSGKLKSSYVTDVDASQGISAVAGPVFGVVANMDLKTGDSFSAGDSAYFDSAANSQQVTSSAPSTGAVAIGIFQGPAVTSAASGTAVPVKLGHRYPGNTLVV